MAKYKEVMTEEEAEELYREELAQGKINTADTPHYDGFLEFRSMLIDMGIRIKEKMKKRYFVLEWNALDDDIHLYDFESEKEDLAEVYEEVAEGLHNYSNVLVMGKKQLGNLFKAVESFKKNRLNGK